MEEEEMEEFDEAVVVGQKPTVMVPRHISKRSLRNKALSINFDEKNLRDFVTGFQKRKKKRRKEAQKQLHEKERRMRIEARKKRKEARELALSSQLKDSNLEQDGCSDSEEDGQSTVASVSETKTYENSNTTIIVTTSELGKDNEELEPVHTIPKLSRKLEKNHKLLAKRKSMKGPAKQKPQKKTSKSAACCRKEKSKMNKY